MYQAFCGISVCDVYNGDGVYGTVWRNVLCREQKLPYSCLCCIDQTQVAIQLSVLYRPNRSCHTAVCAVQTKHKLPYSCLCCIDQTKFDIQLSVLYRPNTWQLPNAARNIYSPPLCFHPLNHNHDTKEYFMCYLVTGSLCVLFTPLQHSISYSNAIKQTASQTLACSQTR